MRRTRCAAAWTLGSLLALSAPAAGADNFLGKFDDWEAHRAGSGNDAVCFIASLPARTRGKLAKRGEATLMVAHFPRRKAFGQVEVKTGFAIKKGGTVELAIGRSRFTLLAEGDSGYGRNTRENTAIVAALKRGTIAAATGVPAAGPRIVDIYSLDGFSKALAAIDKACGR